MAATKSKAGRTIKPTEKATGSGSRVSKSTSKSKAKSSQASKPAQSQPYQGGDIRSMLRALAKTFDSLVFASPDPWEWSCDDLYQKLTSIQSQLGGEPSPPGISWVDLAEKLHERAIDGTRLMITDDVHTPKYGLSYVLGQDNDGSATMLQLIVNLLRSVSRGYQVHKEFVDRHPAERWGKEKVTPLDKEGPDAEEEKKEATDETAKKAAPSGPRLTVRPTTEMAGAPPMRKPRIIINCRRSVSGRA